MASTEPNPGPVVPPTISRVDDQSVMLGQSWEFKIPIGGSCPFEVKMTKDNIKLPETDHIKISSCNNFVSMTINDVKVEDSGEYRFDVSNDSGTATCTFKMIVCQYSFTYQYLLVEIGTTVLRKLFDCKVGHDFSSYLATNKNHGYTLQSLINVKKGVNPTITSAQAQLLPPLDNNPTSSKFDITLLTCLLRNICGLKGTKDLVWNKPTPTDTSEEAYITRLRQCRNNISHSGTVVFPATDFTAKWAELTDILLKLNTFCGKDCITNLQILIDRSEVMDIDEGLTKQLLSVIKHWYDNEEVLRGDMARLETIATTSMGEQRGIKRLVEKIEQTLDASKRPKIDFKDDLMKIYKADCCKLKVSPLCCEDEDEIDLLTIYQPPTMCHMPYHRQQNQDNENYPISSYEKIFCKGSGRNFQNIYITGDAGVGKTSFCQCMTLLWCKSQAGEKARTELMQRDVDYMVRFEFVFYVSLRASDREDILDMIIDQLFYTKSKENREDMYKSIENILKERQCLVILDALDEWTPKRTGKKKREVPVQIRSERCVYLTTCRPYKIENVRLSKRQLDHHVKMTGIHGISSKRYVRAIVKHVNEVNEDNRNPVDFMKEVKQCGLEEQLSIPMVTSQLIVVWFDKKLTDMSRALIYSNIVEMLFERAEKRNIKFLSAPTTVVRHPDSLSELCLIKSHFPHLRETCLLAFRSLFQQDENIFVFVFTEDLLMKEPYCISADKINFLCKIGILSKNKVIGRFGKKEHKLSFLHKSYIEYFAALFVSSFDTSNLFDDIVKNWTTLNCVVQFQNFFRLLAGFSYQNVKRLLENVYLNISGDLTLCRRNSIFHYDSESYSEQIKSLQTLVVNCFQELPRSSDTIGVLKLDDVILIGDNSNDNCVLQLLILNKTCVKSIHSVKGIYYDKFDQIEHLECLNVGKASSDDPLSDELGYDTRFTDCMLHNASTLHTVCIECNYTLLPELPVRDLYRLTSLSLNDVIMQHDILRDLVTFLSDNVLIENIKLHDVACVDHHGSDQSDCNLALNLSNHNQLISLCLYRVDIVCNSVNCASLLYITLDPLFESIFDSYEGVFHCMRESRLEHVFLHGFYVNTLNYYTVAQMISTVETLRYLKSLKLYEMLIPDDLSLHLHPDVRDVKINLYGVTMSRKCFRRFIRSLIESESMIKVEVDWCKVNLGTGETRTTLDRDMSVYHMAEYLEQKREVKITHESGWNLIFETTSS